MEDSDLEKIRQQRMAQLQSQYKGDNSGQNAQKAKEEQAKAQEDAKNSILAQILDQAARARLNTLRMAKPDKGQMVESMLVQMARSGQISSKIGESELIKLLEQISAHSQQNAPTVKFDRRRAALDSDDEDF